MVLDSLPGLNAVHEQLLEFLASPRTTIRLDADVSGSPAPYDEWLGGLEFWKSDGPLLVSLTSDRWLRIEGGQDSLASYVASFAFGDGEEHDHHHPEFEYLLRDGKIRPGSLPIIIEADGEYIEHLKRES